MRRQEKEEISERRAVADRLSEVDHADVALIVAEDVHRVRLPVRQSGLGGRRSRSEALLDPPGQLGHSGPHQFQIKGSVDPVLGSCEPPRDRIQRLDVLEPGRELCVYLGNERAGSPESLIGPIVKSKARFRQCLFGEARHDDERGRLLGPVAVGVLDGRNGQPSGSQLWIEEPLDFAGGDAAIDAVAGLRYVGRTDGCAPTL